MPFTINGTTGINLGTQPLTGSLPDANAPSGGIIQVVSSTKTDTFSSTTTGSWLDVTGLSVSISPISTSSRILIIARVTGAGTVNGTRMQTRILRDSTAISIGDASGSRLQVSGNELYAIDNSAYVNSVITFVDSPSTISSITYKLQVRNGNSSNTIYVNRNEVDTDSVIAPRGTSSITVMEIAA